MTAPQQKIEIKICMGTTCFLLRNSELQDIVQSLSQEIQPYVEVVGAPCLGFCKDVQLKRVPCTMIDGELIEDVEIQQIPSYIEQAVQEKLFGKIKHG